MIKTVTMNPAVDKTVEIADFRIGAVNRITSVRLDAGGKGINVSKTIMALQGSSMATGILAGKNGAYIKDYLDKSLVDNDFIFVKGETRTNLKVVDIINKTNTDINEPGSLNVKEEDLSILEKKIFEDMGSEDILVLSGSVPSTVPAGIYKDWTERAVKSGIRVLLDADRELLREGLKSRPYMVKPNISELENLLGRKLSSMDEIVEAGESLLAKGVELVVISLGEKGAVFLTKGVSIHAEGLKVELKSTVGAGDAMVAALAYALSRGYTLEKAAALSVAAAAAKVASPGSSPPELEAIKALEGRVRLNHLK